VLGQVPKHTSLLVFNYAAACVEHCDGRDAEASARVVAERL